LYWLAQEVGAPASGENELWTITAIWLHLPDFATSIPARLELAKKYMGVDCPVYTDFEQMMAETQPDLVMVCTMDSNHHEFIVRSMELGVDVLTEKPITTDEQKLQAILDAEKRTGKKCIVGFNLRYATLPTALKEFLIDKPVGKSHRLILTGT
jgi:predicted dehydrogenase